MKRHIVRTTRTDRHIIDVPESGDDLEGGAGAGWQTDLDIILADEANANLTSDGAHVISGTTFTKINTANENAVMALVNGAGLRITPKQATDFYGGTRTAPGLTLGLSTIITGFHSGLPLRLWILMKNGNLAAQYDSLKFGVEKATGSIYHFLGSITQVGANRGTGPVATANGAGVGFPISTGAPFNTHNALLIEYPYGVAGGNARVASGITTDNTFPTIGNMRSAGTYLEASGIQAGNYSIANTDWNMIAVAQRAGSGTALVIDIGRIKIEHFGTAG